MRRHHYLLAVLRRAASSASSQRSEPFSHLHPVPPRNGAAGAFSPRLFSSRTRSAAGAAKSLVEDEAELSDWISDLKTDSFHLGVSSGDEGDAPSTRRSATGASRGGRGGRDSSSSFPRSRFDGGEFRGDRRGGFERRGRVASSDLDDYEDDSGFGSSTARGRRGRGERSSGFALRGGRRDGFNDEARFRSPMGQRGRGGRGSGVARRGGRYSDLDDGDGDTGFRSSRGRQGRGGRMSGLSQRRGRESDLDDDDDAIGFGDSDRRPHRGGGRRGERGESVGSRRGRGRRDLGVSSRGGSYSDLDDDDGEIEIGYSRGRWGRGGRMSSLSQRMGMESDLDDDEEDDDDDAAAGIGDSSGRKHHGGRRGGRADCIGPHRSGRGSNMDFGHRQPQGSKKFDFGLSEDDDEVEEFDEDDEPSGFEDNLFDDEGVNEDESKITGNKSGSSESAEEEPSKQGTSTGGGDSYLSQKR